MGRPRLHEESGHTIVEMLSAVLLTVLVSFTGLAVIDGAYRRNDDIQQRADGMSAVRQAMDATTQVLRSQVCGYNGAAPIIEGDGSHVAFYSSFEDASLDDLPQRQVLTVRPTGELVQQTYKPTAGVNGAAPVYPSQPTSTRIITEHVSQSGTTPIFAYYAYTAADIPEATVPLNSASPPYTLATANNGAYRVGRIVVTLKGDPPNRAANSPLATTMQDELYVRLVDPSRVPDASVTTFNAPQVEC